MYRDLIINRRQHACGRTLRSYGGVFIPGVCMKLVTHHFPASGHAPVVPPQETWLRLLAEPTPPLTCLQILQNGAHGFVGLHS